MLSNRLKIETRHNHHELEKKLVGSIKLIRNKEDYTRILNLFYSFFGGLEALIDTHIDISVLADYPNRRKTAALAEDIKQLGSILPSLASGDALPPIQNHPQALGALYVIEGSTLGGKIISKMVGQQLGITNDAGLSFFKGYGEQTDEMWQSFKQTIDSPAESGDHNIIIQSANDTFVQFSNWFDRSRV